MHPDMGTAADVDPVGIGPEPDKLDIVYFNVLGIVNHDRPAGGIADNDPFQIDIAAGNTKRSAASGPVYAILINDSPPDEPHIISGYPEASPRTLLRVVPVAFLPVVPAQDRTGSDIHGLAFPNLNGFPKVVDSWSIINYVGIVRRRNVPLRRIDEDMKGMYDVAIHFNRQVKRAGHHETQFVPAYFRNDAGAFGKDLGLADVFSGSHLDCGAALHEVEICKGRHLEIVPGVDLVIHRQTAALLVAGRDLAVKDGDIQSGRLHLPGCAERLPFRGRGYGNASRTGGEKGCKKDKE